MVEGCRRVQRVLDVKGAVFAVTIILNYPTRTNRFTVCRLFLVYCFRVR